jgi:ATP-dependent DNA ligase
MRRFEDVLDLLPRDCVFDGELVALDDPGASSVRPLLLGLREEDSDCILRAV